ncbi:MULTISPECIES: hypothetical protein [unclassified Methylobacterium]|uniref:hypothetical protein n=1 Tax=unclassified Methylobacterium TaxID=2615210 RepID=UPI0013525860|nr:hypothetical protein [Methylobacterium sp. 2A]MWV22426.1 hypothetical protein [Methylobacterium sp. 2A]
MKTLLFAAALAAAPAPPPGQGPGRWLVIVRQVRPDGALLARLTFQRLVSGTRWELRCYDTTVSPPEARHFDGVAKPESEWVMGEVPRVGNFTLALRGDPLWAAWIPGCPGMAEPDIIARAPGSW